MECLCGSGKDTHDLFDDDRYFLGKCCEECEQEVYARYRTCKERKDVGSVEEQEREDSNW